MVQGKLFSRTAELLLKNLLNYIQNLRGFSSCTCYPPLALLYKLERLAKEGRVSKIDVFLPHIPSAVSIFFNCDSPEKLISLIIIHGLASLYKAAQISLIFKIA